MSSRLRSSSMSKDRPKATSFGSDTFYYEPEERNDKRNGKAARENSYRFGDFRRECSERNGRRFGEEIEEDPDILYKRSKDRFASWDMKDIAGRKEINEKKKEDEEAEEEEEEEEEEDDEDVNDNNDKPPLLYEEYVPSPRKENQKEKIINREIHGSRKDETRKNEDSSEGVDSRNYMFAESSAVRRNGENRKKTSFPSIDVRTDTDHRIGAMIERLKTREEDKLRNRRERGSPERGGVISSTIEDRRQRRRRRCLVDEELGNRQEDDTKTSVGYDQRFDDFCKSNRGEETRVDRRRSRSIEKVSRYELGRARSNDANGFRELDERIPRYMLREAESHVREEMFGLNVDDNVRRIEGRRAPFDRDNDRREKENSSRKSQDAYVVEITRRRSRSKDVEEDRARTKDETKSSNSSSTTRPYEVLPGEFDVRIQRYERATVEDKRDQEYLKKNLHDPSKERETVRKISFSGDTDMYSQRMHSKKEIGITRRTSFKDQDNEIRGRNSFKNDSDGGIKCTIKSRKSDVTEREKTELVDSVDLGRRSSFKAKHPEYGKISFEEEEKEKRSSRDHTRVSNARIISFGDDKIVGERKRTPDNQDRGIITSISFKDENSVESTTSPIRRVSKEQRENVLGRRISFKDRGIESEREHSYGVYCDVGKDQNEEESKRRSSSFDDRFVESDRNFFTSRERGVSSGTSPWKDRNDIESRVRSSNGPMIKKVSEEGTRDKKLEKHSRAFTSGRVDEDIKENFQETKDRKDFWRESNRLFAAKYLKENGRGRRTEGGILGKENNGSLVEGAYEEDEGDESEIEQEDSIRTNGRRIPDNRDFDSKGRIARERNGTTIVRIRPNISENSRRRRRMQDFGLERRKRCDVSSQRYDSDEESGEEGEKEDQRKEEEKDKKKVMPIVKDDEDADNEQRLDSWRGTRRDGLIPGIPHGSTPSRRLWNYREGGVLITDVEEGQPCLQCGDVCPGFSPHIWRRVSETIINKLKEK
ncbi:trichohyalin-like isoform X2 [Vespa mandarinia]|uniref:trichohyalin-like isoform X2 n=1 Tax=Vespa mandarinia TaxID=7446 RepID=UPI001611C2D3|nr:trichohyalin-like isoform X2 [Vespa mandarinia]